jgi:hypothetical protein
MNVTPAAHPEFFLLDVPDTYSVGSPLAGEIYEGPFTGKPFIADFSALRNLCWSLGTCDWKLTLDEDERLVDPEVIPSVCHALREREFDVGITRHLYTPTPGHVVDTFTPRLARNVPYLSWSGISRESLAGARRACRVEGSLIVYGTEGAPGARLRAPGDSFKSLYAYARKANWRVKPPVLLHLAMEAKDTMPDFALAAIDAYLERSLWPEERSLAWITLGEIMEGKKLYAEASSAYSSAVDEYPGAKSSFRLCRTRFREQKWGECIAAYEEGIANREVPTNLDLAKVSSQDVKILVIAALEKMGKAKEALAMCKESMEVSPGNSALEQLHELLLSKVKE